MSALIPALIQLAIGRMRGGGGGGGYPSRGGYGGRGGAGGSPKPQFSTAEKNAYRDLLQIDKSPNLMGMINELDEQINALQGIVGHPERGANIDIDRFTQE